MDPTVYAQAIKDIESSGGNYGAVGPATNSGDRAYGAYQVMGNNIPDWTETHYGQRLTPDQFLKNKAAQDAVFHGQFGSYVDKYGTPQDAASAWFTGRPIARNNNSSDGYTTANEYVDRFNKGVAKYSGSPVAAINNAAGIKPSSGPALAFAADDGEEEDGAPSGALSATPGALSNAPTRVMNGDRGENKLNTIGQGMVSAAAALAGISSPGQASALTNAAAAMKKDNQSKYHVSVTKDGRIVRVDDSGNVDVIGGNPNGAASTDFLGPELGDHTLVKDANDPTQRAAFLKSISDKFGANAAQTVSDLADYTYQPPTAAAIGRKGSPYPALFSAAKVLNPTLDMAQYGSQFAGAKDWATGGKSAESVRAGNQTLEHQGDALIGAMQDLNNGQYPIMNSAKNFWNNTVLGHAGVGAFKTTAHAVADEMGKLFKGQGISDREIKSWEENLPDNMSPEQQRSEAKTLVKLLHGGFDALTDKRVSALGARRAAAMGPLMSEKAQAALKRVEAFANSGSTPAAPATSTTTVQPGGHYVWTPQGLKQK